MADQDCNCQEKCTTWVVITSILSFLLAVTIAAIVTWFYYRYRQKQRPNNTETKTDEEIGDPPVYDTYADTFQKTVTPDRTPPPLPKRHIHSETHTIAFDNVKEDEHNLQNEGKKQKPKRSKKKRKLTDVQVLTDADAIGARRRRSDSMRNKFKTDESLKIKKSKQSVDTLSKDISEVPILDDTSDISKQSNKELQKSTNSKMDVSEDIQKVTTKRNKEEQQIEEIFEYLEDIIAAHGAVDVDGAEESDIETPELRVSLGGSKSENQDESAQSADFFEISRPNSPIPDEKILKWPNNIPRDSHVTTTQKPYKSRIFVYANPDKKNLKRVKSLPADTKWQSINALNATNGDDSILPEIDQTYATKDNQKQTRDEKNDSGDSEVEFINMIKPISNDTTESSGTITNDIVKVNHFSDTNNDRTRHSDERIISAQSFGSVQNGKYISDPPRQRSKTPAPVRTNKQHEMVQMNRSKTPGPFIKSEGLNPLGIVEPLHGLFQKHVDIQSTTFSNEHELQKSNSKTANMKTEAVLTDKRTLLKSLESTSKTHSIQLTNNTFENDIYAPENRDAIENTINNQRTSDTVKDDERNKIKEPSIPIKASNSNSLNIENKQLQVHETPNKRTNNIALTNTNTHNTYTSKSVKVEKKLDDILQDVQLPRPVNDGVVTEGLSWTRDIPIRKRAMTPDPISHGLVYNQHFAANVRRSKSLHVQSKNITQERVLPQLTKIEHSKSLEKTDGTDENLSKGKVMDKTTNNNDPSNEGEVVSTLEKTNMELTAAKLRNARHTSKGNGNHDTIETLHEEPDLEQFKLNTSFSRPLRDVSSGAKTLPSMNRSMSWHNNTLHSQETRTQQDAILRSSEPQAREYKVNSTQSHRRDTNTKPISDVLSVKPKTGDRSLEGNFSNISESLRLPHNGDINKHDVDTSSSILHRSMSVQEKTATQHYNNKVPVIEEENKRKRRYSTLTTPIPDLSALPTKSILKKPGRTMSERNTSIDTIPLSQFVSSATTNKRIDNRSSSFLRSEHQTTKLGDRSIAFSDRDVFIGSQGSRDSMVQRSLSYSSQNNRPPTPAVNMLDRRKRNSLLDKRDWRLSSTKF